MSVNNGRGAVVTRGECLDRVCNVFVDKQVLKSKLQETFPRQVCHYHCQVDGVDSSTGREKVNFTISSLLFSAMLCFGFCCLVWL